MTFTFDHSIEYRTDILFITAWIYSSAYETLTDVTEGSSYGCNTTGFPAQEGWDAGESTRCLDVLDNEY